MDSSAVSGPEGKDAKVATNDAKKPEANNPTPKQPEVKQPEVKETGFLDSFVSLFKLKPDAPTAPETKTKQNFARPLGSLITKP